MPLEACSELLMHFLLEINCHHSILHNELQDLLGAAERLRLLFHADGQNHCARQDPLFKPCGKAVHNSTNRLGLGR